MSKNMLIVIFNLKKGVSEKDYEDWAIKEDVPIVSGLTSVSEYKVYRSLGIFGSEESPPYRYIEMIAFSDLDQFTSDISSEKKMDGIVKKFQSFADNPIFMITEAFA